jgi:tetratricopeptide (TPR) repeat protein
LRVESVAWITERRDVLSSAFFLMALLAYLRAVRTASSEIRAGWFCAAIGSFAVSMLCKALGMALPVVLLVIDVYPLRRHERIGWGRILAEKLPFLLVSIAGAWIALRAQTTAGALVDTSIHGWIGRITVVFYGIAFYPRAMIAAREWYPLYEVTRAIHPSESRFALSIAFVVAVTVALYVVRRRAPALLAVWIAYIALLGPVSGIAQSGIHLVADRYSYLSCLGFALLLGYGVGHWWSRANARVACASVTILIVAYWSVRSWQQAHVWRDEPSLWTHVLRQGPSTVAYDNLGADANRRGDRAAALDYFARALEILPENLYARNDMVAILSAGDPRARRDVLERAAESLHTSLSRSRSTDAQAWYALGLVRLSLQQRESAAAAFERVLVLDPGNVRASNVLEQVRAGGH